MEKLYAKYPLIGNALISESNMEKINAQAKHVLDKLVENPALSLDVPIKWHLFIALAVVNYAKKWNALEESRFTKYITLQFGYRDDTGKVWGILSGSLERALSFKNRFFLISKGEREFYETVLVHSFAPENSWDSIFDLLFDFLKNNLRWNYIKGDPIVKKMVTLLSAKMNGNTADDEDLVISAKMYRIRLGAKRLLQNRPVYTLDLFGYILDRIADIIQNQAGKPKVYIDLLIDTWFTKKLSRMIEGEKNQIYNASRIVGDTALSYERIRVLVYMKERRLYIHIPAIRLEETECKFAEIKIFENDKIIGKSIPEIYGNELGETLNECEVPIVFSPESKCDISVKIYCDGDTIFDSGQSLYRKFYVFKKSKECSINSLKPGIYEMYIPDMEQVQFNNVDVIIKSGKYVKVNLLEDFSITYVGKIVAIDTTKIQETIIAEPVFKSECIYLHDGAKYDIAEVGDAYKLYFNRAQVDKCVHMYCCGKVVDLNKYWDGRENSGVICEIPLSELIEVGSVGEICLINFETNAVVYKKEFLLVDSLNVKFNKEFYVLLEDFSDAKVWVTINGKRVEFDVRPGDKEILVEYAHGEIQVDVPYVQYFWQNVDNIRFGNNIWKEDLKENSLLVIDSVPSIKAYVEIGDYTYRMSRINLFHIKQKEEFHAAFNYPVILLINDQRYKLGQLIFSEMFTKMPVFTSDGEAIYWDGGINYIGNISDCLKLQLFKEDALKYELQLQCGNNKVNLPIQFEDGEYTYLIVRNQGDQEIILAQDIQFFGNPNRTRFQDRTIQITEITEDVGEGSKPQKVKSVYIEQIRFLERKFVPAEEGIFDIYEGLMYFVRMDGTKKYYSYKYSNHGNISYYKVNPVRIIYINDKILRIVNKDDEGLYCYDNFGTKPSLEITDREPGKADKFYKDILFYLYQTDRKIIRHADDSNTVIYQRYLDMDNIFNKFKKVSQREVIGEAASKRILINAGPGTGKTWVLIERMINLVDVQGIDPETILVLCFSKAAVEVIKGRLEIAVKEGRVSEIVNQIDVRTFDSFASQVLYWVKNESEYEDLHHYDIGIHNYDERIQRFVNLIKVLPELISQCKHLIVDEVQDLVKNRARMVLEMIRSIPEDAGVTLLGDSCQSIYDYQAGDDSMSSMQFYRALCEKMTCFSYYTFDRNFRQGDELACLSDNYRKAILSGNCKSCDHYWGNVIKKQVQKFDEYEAVKIDGEQLKRLYAKGTIGILTRTNGQALKISSALREQGIEHVFRKRLTDNSLNKWIALLFNNYSNMSINREQFEVLYDDYCMDGERKNSEKVWNALRDTIRNSSERIGVREILRGLLENARNPLLYSEERESTLTITNIHRGKGREFDTVLVEDDIFSEDEKTLDEHKVCYVALTRPREAIYRISAEAEYMQIDKDGDRRCFKADYVRYNKQRLVYFEVGIGSDLDPKSFVRIENVQKYIRDNFASLVGKKISLCKDRHRSDYMKYNIVLDETRMILGYTSREFGESLTRVLRAIYKLPRQKAIYYNVYPDKFSDIYIEDIISVVDQVDGYEKDVIEYGEMVSWNMLNIVGLGKAEYI